MSVTPWCWVNVAAVLYCLTSPQAAAELPVDGEFTHFAELSPNEYHLFWKSQGDGKSTKDVITFEVHARTLGWVGLGFSPHGSMAGADIVVGGVMKNGEPYLWDRHATENGFPMPDKVNNYKLLAASENGTHTVLRFSRPMITCDSENDYPLGADTVRVIYAYHEDDAIDPNNFEYHTTRGVVSVLLLRQQLKRSALEPRPNERVTHLDFTVDKLHVSNTTTTVYWCKAFQITNITKKHHLIGYEPLLEEKNRKDIHHMLLYHCYYNMSQFLDKEGFCYAAEIPDSKSAGQRIFHGETFCNLRLLTAWASGATPAIYPDQIGLPLFEEGQSNFFMLEMHYNNPSHHDFFDSSGVRLHLTEDLRPVESVGLGTGSTVDLTFIPPGQKVFTLRSICPAACSQAIPKTGVKVLSAFLHGHYLARSIKVRHIRDGVELPPVAEDLSYDFNFQRWIADYYIIINTSTCNNIRKTYFINDFRKEDSLTVKIRPLFCPYVCPLKYGDVLTVECTYDSTGRTDVTLGGYASTSEMCWALLEYYPRVPAFTTCYSHIDTESAARALNITATPGAVRPSTTLPDGSIIELGDYSKTLQWNAPGEVLNENGRSAKTEVFINQMQKGKSWVVCGGTDVGKQDKVTRRRRDAAVTTTDNTEPPLAERTVLRELHEQLPADLSRPYKAESPCSLKLEDPKAGAAQNSGILALMMAAVLALLCLLSPLF